MIFPQINGLFLSLKACHLLNPESAFSKEAKGLDLGISEMQSYEQSFTHVIAHHGLFLGGWGLVLMMKLKPWVLSSSVF